MRASVKSPKDIKEVDTASLLLASGHVINTTPCMPAEQIWYPPGQSMPRYGYPAGLNPYYYPGLPYQGYNMSPGMMPPGMPGMMPPGPPPPLYGAANFPPESVELTADQQKVAQCVLLVHRALAPHIESGASAKKPILRLPLDIVRSWQDHRSLVHAGQSAGKLLMSICRTYTDLSLDENLPLKAAFISELKKTLRESDIRTLREVASISGQGGEEIRSFLLWIETNIPDLVKNLPPPERLRPDDFSVESCDTIGGITVDLETLISDIAEANENLQETKFSKLDGMEAIFREHSKIIEAAESDVNQIKQYAQIILSMSPAEQKLLPPNTVECANYIINPPTKSLGGGGLSGLFGGMGGGSSSGGGLFGSTTSNPFASAFSSNTSSSAKEVKKDEDPLLIARIAESDPQIMTVMSNPLIKKILAKRDRDELEQGKAVCSIALCKAIVKVMNSLSNSSALSDHGRSLNKAIAQSIKEQCGDGHFTSVIMRELGGGGVRGSGKVSAFSRRD